MTVPTAAPFADRYLLKETALQAGSTGRVYYAEDTFLGRTVALKIIDPVLASQADFQDRFLAEAKALAGLHHPGVVTIFDASLQPQPHLVMAYAGQHNLRREMVLSRQKGRIVAQHVISVALQIAQTLHYVHTKTKLIHGDVKPENILVSAVGTADQAVILTDFGLARLQDSQTDHLAGTAAYLAPEQVLGQAVDGRTDLYALGVVLYEWLAKGELPIPVRSLEDARRLVPHHEPAPLAEHVPQRMQALARIVMRLLAKDPTDRYASAESLIGVLEPMAGAAPPRQTYSNGSGKLEWVEEVPTGNHLAVSEQLPLYHGLTPKQNSFIIGSDPDCDFRLVGEEIAPHHARLLREGQTWKIEPLGSQQILVDQQKVYKVAVPLAAGQRVRIGSHFLQLHLDEADTPAAQQNFRLMPQRLELLPGETAVFEVVIGNGTKQRAYYHIMLKEVAETAVSWFSIPDDGLPLAPADSASLFIHVQTPPDAKPGHYGFKVCLQPLATNEGERELEGMLVVRQSVDFSVDVRPTLLEQDQISWVTLENRGNQPTDFLLTLSDKEDRLLFAVVPSERLRRGLGAETSSATDAGQSASAPTGAAAAPFQMPNPAVPRIPTFLNRIPLLGGLLRWFSQNPLSRWWRQLRSRVSYARGLGSQIPWSRPASQAAPTPVIKQPVAYYRPPRLHRLVQHPVRNIAANASVRVPFVVEAREQPAISRRPHDYTFTVGVAAANAEPQLRAATVTVPPRWSTGWVVFLMVLLFLLPLILLGSRSIATRNRVLPTYEAGATWAAGHLDEDGTPNGAEIVAGTDPEVAPTATATPTVAGTAIAELTLTPTVVATAVLTAPLKIYSNPIDDGYIIHTPLLRTEFSTGEQLIVGDDAANGAIRSLISFDASAITPDTDLRQVSLFLWFSPVIEGESPVKTAAGEVIPDLGHYLNVDMAAGGFGTGVFLEALDFDAPVGTSGLQVVRRTGTMPNNAQQIRLDFGEKEPIVLAALKNYDVVEFRLYLELPSNENGVAEQLHFSSGEAVAVGEDGVDQRPFLHLTYGQDD